MQYFYLPGSHMKALVPLECISSESKYILASRVGNARLRGWVNARVDEENELKKAQLLRLTRTRKFLATVLQLRFKWGGVHLDYQSAWPYKGCS